MEPSLFDRLALISELSSAGYENVTYAHANELAFVFHTDVGLVAVKKEDGSFPSKEYRMTWK